VSVRVRLPWRWPATPPRSQHNRCPSLAGHNAGAPARMQARLQSDRTSCRKDARPRRPQAEIRSYQCYRSSWRGLLPGAPTPGESRFITPETTPPSIPTNPATAPAPAQRAGAQRLCALALLGLAGHARECRVVEVKQTMGRDKSDPRWKFGPRLLGPSKSLQSHWHSPRGPERHPEPRLGPMAWPKRESE
jgi:hypothetical protein